MELRCTRSMTRHKRPTSDCSRLDERHQASDRCTEPVLSAIQKMMRDESLEASQALDKAFHEALSMFDKSIKTCHQYPGAYAKRAHAYRDMADNILMAYWIYPERILGSWTRFPAVGVGKMERDKTIQHENVLLGFGEPKLFTGCSRMVASALKTARL